MWHDRIVVAFGYPRDGWVLMVLMTAAFNQHAVVHCSELFQPFGDLLVWLNQIADGKLPASFSVDEEGVAKRLVATRSPLGEDTVEFAVEGALWKAEAVLPVNHQFLHCRVDRLQLVDEFVKRLSRWLEEDYDPSEFGYRSEEDLENGYGFDLKALDLAVLARKLPNLGSRRAE